MLYFSKFKSTLIILVALFGLIVSMPNFFNQESVEKWPVLFPSNKINLGLDLAGGSHLLIEVDVPVVISERIETIYNDLRILLRKERVSIEEITKGDDYIFISLSESQSKEKLVSAVDDLSQPILGLSVPNQNSKEIILTEDISGLTIRLSEEAVNSLTSRSVDQSIEIVRRRIDELGTKEPSIQRQGKERI